MNQIPSATTQSASGPPAVKSATDDEFAARFSQYASYKTTPAAALALFEDARSRRCPVPHSDESGGFYVLLNYQDVREAHLDHETFSTEPGVMRPIGDRPRLPPLEFDPPAHSEWRKVFREAVNARTPGKIEAAVRADIRECIDRFAARGTCDLVTDFAEPIPLWALCHAVGMDRARAPEFRRLAIRFVETFGDDEAFADTMRDFTAFAVREVEERRAAPRDDYLTWLGQTEMNGQLLGPAEIGGTLAALLTAGHDTSVIGLTMTLFEIVRRPGIKAQLLENTDLIPAAVDEGLRLYPPFIGFFRRATRRVTVNGTDIPEGASIQLCWAAANRDPEVFPDPEDFRLDRKPGANRHLTFGLGIHACIGQSLARLELRIAIEELLKRLPDIELTDPAAAEYKFIGPENATINSLPARFSPG